MVALASWAPGDVQTSLTIDWRALGINPAKATILAPEIAGFQSGKMFTPGKPILVPQGKGWLLIIEETH